jgi:flagellar basal-body rod modification protein FlgD
MLNGINAIGAAAGLSSGAAAPTQELGEQEFLNLLMTQLGNQDPLNPMQSAEFAQQVASMNQVKQLMGANERLDQLMLGMTSMSNQSAVQLVGKEVIAKGDTFHHDAKEAHQLQIELPTAADSITVTIRDAEGREVRTFDRFDVEAGMQTIPWSGIGIGNADVPPGDLTFDVQAKDADGEPIEVTTYIRGTVDELRFDRGFPMLLVGGTEVSMDQVLRVLDAEPGSLEALLGETPDPEAAAADTSTNSAASASTFEDA